MLATNDRFTSASALAMSFYGAVVEKVVSVSSPATAEAVKITENVFRAVNIALVNELKVIYDAMKPGAVVGVIDHVANPGDTRATVEKLHRIDPEVIKADFKRAGFKLEGTSDLLRNPADDHSLNVFDPKIRGKTDRVILKFRKPR